tara:strand:+ start:3744 stop:4727 length:984 start_codon:yes stop_codon:yes gene_type:complete
MTTNQTIYEDSWQVMMRKCLLASISEKNPLALSNGPLSQMNPSGLTRIAKHVLDQQSASILSVADDIWIAIMQIQDLMETRNSINENCMKSEEEANRLLKTTNSIQNLIEHISEQEDEYIKLSESINKNTIHLVQSYLNLMKSSAAMIDEIAQEVSDSLNLKLVKQNEGVERGVLNATSINELERFSMANTLESHTNTNPIVLMNKYLNHQQYDDFIIMQTFILVCYRFSMSQAVTNRSTQFDAKRTLLAVIDHKSKASTILQENDEEKTFSLENFSQQKTTSNQMQLALKINPDFIMKIKQNLNELKQISDSRKPDEEDDSMQKAA